MNASLTGGQAPAGAAPPSPALGLRLLGIDDPAAGSAGLAERLAISQSEYYRRRREAIHVLFSVMISERTIA